MNLEAEILDIKRTQARIDSKLTTLLGKSNKQTWVKVSFITDLTGWSREKLRQSRNQGIIQYRRSKGKGFEYLLESLSEVFIIKKAV